MNKQQDFTETVVLDAETKMRETSDGYLVANPRIARTGIQVYSGAELGRPDLKQVRVYRPEAEVFHADAIASLAHKPVTDEHPREQVNSRNWKNLAVGHLGDEILRDGEFVRVPLVLMDADIVDEVRKGKSQLSVGYTAMLAWADGVTDKGEAYDATQTAIRANHVAITHTARGGPKLRMGDDDPHNRRTKMTTRTMMIDGISVEMEERDLQVVERRISGLEKDLGTARADLATLQATSQTELATARTETANAAAVTQTKDAEITTLKQQLVDSKLSPLQLDKMVHDRVQVVQRAKSIIGDAVLVDGKMDSDIRRQVVNAKLGATAKDWTDEMITASFNTLTATVDSGAPNDLRHVVNVLQHTADSGVDQRTKAYQEYDDLLANRWKTAGVRQHA